MPLSSEDLQQVAARTLAHYEQHAQSYWEGTRDHDVSQNIAALLKHIPGPPPFDLLDFGCGPGRDLHTFKALGHCAVGLEGAPQRCGAGARPQRLRGAGAELPAPRPTRTTLRRCFCKCRAVSCALPGAAAGAATTAGLPAAGRRAVQLQPARRWPGRLER